MNKIIENACFSIKELIAGYDYLHLVFNRGFQ